MRMFTIPNQSSVAKAYEEFHKDDRHSERKAAGSDETIDAIAQSIRSH
jgi:hypothetical protein